MSATDIYGPRFTDGVARLERKGGIHYERGKRTCADTYVVGLSGGARPATSTVSGIPKIGSPLEDDESMGCKSIDWSQPDPHSNVWYATVNYESGVFAVMSQEDPEEEPVEVAIVTDVEFGTRTVQADFVNDAITGKAVVNTAGDPFESIPQREIVLPSITLTELSNLSPSVAWAANGSVNASNVTICGMAFGPHQARLTFSCRPAGDDTGYKYEYHITIEGSSNMHAPVVDKSSGGQVSNIGWDVSLLNAGYQQVTSGKTVPILVQDQVGKLVRPQQPLPLTLDGEYDPDEGNLYFLSYSPYPASSNNWAAFHLPSTVPTPVPPNNGD